MTSICEDIKVDFLLRTIPDKHRKIKIDERLTIAMEEAESSLSLLNVPDKDALTLQIAQERSKKELSW
jgi:hypothetical protein